MKPYLKAYDKNGKLLATGHEVVGDRGAVIVPNLAPHTTYPEGSFFISWQAEQYETEKVAVPEFTTHESTYKEFAFYFKDHIVVKTKTAYDIAVDNGFTGTEEEWVASIKGEKGDKMKFSDLTESEKEELKGEQGIQGIQGVAGRDSEKAPFLPLIVKTPLLFNWKEHPLRDKIITDGKGKFDVKFDITQLKLTGGTSYYVDAVNGDDSNDGLTLAKAIKNIKTVLPKLNDNDTLYIADGYYFRVNGTLFTTGFNKSVNMIALGDNVNMIMADEPAWVKTSGKQNVYEVTRSAAKRVINLNNMLGRTPQEFKPVSSIDLVETTPYSFFTDNVKVYVNSGNVPNNKVVPLLSSTMLRVTNPTGNFYMENINFFGGNSSARFVLTSANNVYLNKMNLQFSCQTNGNGLEVVGGNTIISVNSEASNNWMDGFNYHIGADGSKPNAIEINCVALENGYEKGEAGNKSNNGTTIHDGLKAIRINGIYGRNDGGNIADVNADTQSWNLGCVGFESYQNKDFHLSSGSHMFLDSCIGYGSSSSIHSAYSDNKIYTRMGQYQNKFISAGTEINY